MAGEESNPASRTKLEALLAGEPTGERIEFDAPTGVWIRNPAEDEFVHGCMTEGQAIAEECRERDRLEMAGRAPTSPGTMTRQAMRDRLEAGREARRAVRLRQLAEQAMGDRIGVEDVLNVVRLRILASFADHSPGEPAETFAHVVNRLAERYFAWHDASGPSAPFHWSSAIDRAFDDLSYSEDEDDTPAELRAQIEAENKANEALLENERHVRARERIAQAGVSFGTPLDQALMIIDHAQTLAFMTYDPSRRDAFETIKLAVRAMLGQRDKLPIDAPVRLLKIIKDGEALNTKDADYRAVVDLIERRERWVRESGQRGVANESGPLCEDVKWVVSDLFLDLTEADCRAALGRLAAGEHEGANGVAADLFIAVKAHGWVEEERQALLSAISRAAGRRTPKKNTNNSEE